MGLIIEDIEITLVSRNIKHYEKLGYDIPKAKNKKKNICDSKEYKLL